MIQEYLFIENTHRESVEGYKPNGVTLEINCIKNSDCWIAIYSVHGENRKSAELLSTVNDHMLKNFQPTVLSNGSSAYFNRVLFPYINEFERKLRKLLYLKSAICKGDKFSENIRDLESKDLGAIFELLFTDEKFVKEVKSQVNNKSWQFTKAEILSAMENLSEETVWSHLIGEDAVPKLRQDFLAVKNYRNDVMHAHNIGAQTFRTTKKLFTKINQQLDTEIGKILSIAETHSVAEESYYNSYLNRAITDMNFAPFLRAFTQEASPEFLKLQELIADFNAASKILAATQVSPEIMEMGETIKRLQEEHDAYRKYIEDIQNGQG